MIDGEEQEILLNTLAETPQEEVHTIEEDIYVIGVESLNGQAGDLTLKSINGENLVGEGNIALQTPLNQAQLNAVNSGIDSTKVGQIATNATNITTLQNTKQDNLTQAQLNAVNSGIDATKVAQIATNTGNITSVTNRVTTIEGKIPSAASSSNKLTDKNYVDNAIATNTANYISDNGQPFQSYADLVAYSGPLTNNDYAFVETIDQAGNDIYTRYKYNADQNLWAEEYTITNPYFTSDQWASINSGIAANDVAQIGTNKTEIATLQTSKQDKLTTAQQAAVDSGIDTTKVQQIATNTTNIATKQDKLIAGTNIQIATDGKTISATDTKYTAGTGLTLTGTQFSVTEPVPSGFFTDTTTSQTSEGTDLTINGTTEAPLKNVELKGDTFQQTYSGKNLMPQATALGETDLGEGIRVTAYRISLPAGTYTISFNLDNFELGTNTSAGIYMQLFGDSSTSLIDNLMLTLNSSTVVGRYSATFTISSAATTANQSNIRFPAGVFNNGARASLSNIQIELGSTATAYEPYVGGVPSPNPDYPQDIQVVTGEQTVTVTGKNLFDGILESGYINGTTGQNASNDTLIRDKNYIPVEELANYKFSCDNSNVTTVFVYEYKADKTYNLSSNKSVPLASYLTTDAGTAFIRFRPSYMTTDTSIKFQVEKGTVATTYEPYQSQTYEVNLGKNLWGGFANDYSITQGGISFLTHADGTVTAISGTATATAYNLSSVQARNNGFTVNLPAGSYTISGSTTQIPVALINAANGTQIVVSTGGVPATVSLSSGMSVFLRAQIPSGTSVSNETVYPQLEAGSTATSYAPYFTPIELCGIGKKPDGTYTYQDRIWKDGDTWKVHKAMGKVVFDGSETWTLSNNTNLCRTDVPDALVVATQGTIAPAASNYFSPSTWTALSDGVADYGLAMYYSAGRIAIRNKNFSTKDDYTTWLSTHNTIVHYALATPTDTAITDATLIAQLEALWNATSYNPQTNIVSTTPAPNLPAILTIDTFKNNWAGTLAGYQETINRLEARVEELEA